MHVLCWNFELVGNGIEHSLAFTTLHHNISLILTLAEVCKRMILEPLQHDESLGFVLFLDWRIGLSAILKMSHNNTPTCPLLLKLRFSVACAISPSVNLRKKNYF
jgi:hypothetical protein